MCSNLMVPHGRLSMAEACRQEWVVRAASTLDDYVGDVTLTDSVIQELSQCNLKAVDKTKKFSNQGRNCSFAASPILERPSIEVRSGGMDYRRVADLGEAVLKLQLRQDDVPFDGYAIVLPLS